MSLSLTSEWKVTTIWNSRELPLFNFELLYMWCPKPVIRVKSYDHLNFSRAFVIQFRTSWYIMRLNRTSEWKVITIWISPVLPLFNFVRLDILCSWIGPSSEKLWPFEFLESFRCSIFSISTYYAFESDLRVKTYKHLNFSIVSVVEFWASRYIMRLNRSSEWKVMTIWICRVLTLFNFGCLDILCIWIGPPSQKL